MLSRHVLLSMLFLSVTLLQALNITEDNKREILRRWHDNFEKEYNLLQIQLDRTETSERNKYKLVKKMREVTHYAQLLKNITDHDVRIAIELIEEHCDHDLWDIFMQKKDLDSILTYITFLKTQLQRFITINCTIDFPFRLENIADEINRSGLNEEEFCTRLRQAFFAFTIIVSKMAYETSPKA